MKCTALVIVFFIIQIAHFTSCNENFKHPTVIISILVRNKAHTLPYFLSLLEEQDYPKHRIALWIRSDNNVDNTIETLNVWLEKEGKNYHSIDAEFDRNSERFENEGIADWSAERFLHVINLREKALRYARDFWADFIWMLDADVFLTNKNTLKNLVYKKETVVAPLLKSDGLYSNFWAGMTAEYYYLRTDKYEPILFAEEKGCFDVPMVHSAVLIDLRKSQSNFLTYNPNNIANYDGPEDDIITFAISANKSEVPLHICNDESYGYIMIPLENDDTIADDLERLVNLKVEILTYEKDLPVSKLMQQFVVYPEETAMKIDEVYMINLVRRPERRRRMHRLLKELGIRAVTVDAVDGRALNESTLEEWGVKMMPQYADPYRKRPITAGEIGCFLSHYLIWRKTLDNDYKSVMVLEDDVRFEPYFRQKMSFIMDELNELEVDWDLVYLGRKKLIGRDEPQVRGSKYLVYSSYSYWTLGYLLSGNGARKLVQANPLEKIVPVDEYLPIMSNVHPRDDWMAHFPKRDLKMLSASPLLIHPTHYTGEQGYISDTEDSSILNEKARNAAERREEL